MKRVLCVLAALLLASSAHAQIMLRQSTAVDIGVGPFVDSTDGVTAESGLTLSQADVRLKKNGGAWAQKSDTNSCTHEENGWYECALNTTDTDSVGILIVAVNETGALPVFIRFQVVEEAVYDRDNASAATGIVGTAQTGDAYARLGAPAGASIAADLVTIDNFVDDLETRLGTPSDLGGGATVAGNLSDIEAQTDDIGAAGAGLTAADDSVMTRLGAPAGASMSADIAAVKSDSAAILLDTGTDGVVIAEITGNCREVLGCDTQGTLNGTHSTTTADLGTNAPANDITGMTLVIPSRNFSRAISSYNTSTGVATWETATAVTLANSDQYYLYGTAPSSGGGGLDAAGIRSAIGLASANLDTQLTAIDNYVDTEIASIISTIGTPSNLGGGATLAANLSDIEGQTDDIGVAGAGLTAADDSVMTRLGVPAGASVSADIAAAKADTAAILLDTGTDGVVVASGSKTGYSLSASGIDAIWDEPQSGHVTAGTFGLYLDSAISGVSTGGVSAADIADAVWDEATSGHVSAGTFAVAVTDILTDTGTTLDDLVDDLETRLTSTRAGYLDNLSAGAVSTASAVSAISTTIGASGAGLTALPWNSSWDAEVQSEVTDALNALTLTEPAAVPTWGSSTLAQWVAWIGAWSRNEVQQTSSTKTLRNDADNAAIATCAVSDNGTTFQVSKCQ